MDNGEDWSEETFARAEEALGYRFTDRELLKTAFTHASYAAAYGGRDNERLEFLGDAAIELVVTEALFLACRDDEGALTELRKRFVSKEALERAEERIGLMRFLRHSGGENNLGGKTRSNLFEAAAGAIFLDGGFGQVKAWLRPRLVEAETVNYKSLLQELTQEEARETPAYRTRETEDGFICTAYALGEEATGSGSSKKAAQTQAAERLYTKLRKRDRK